MKISKLNTLLALLVSAAGAFSAQAQLKLPASHNDQHNTLIANQTPTNNPFKIENNNVLMNQVKVREAAASIDKNIFSNFWESQAVNPYGNAVTIPEHKNIDVSEFHNPVKGPVSSHYGYRPRFGRFHYGVDISLHVGDTVRAAFSGKVRLTRFEGKGYGYYVVVRHDNGMETVYGHLSRFLVKPNQLVKAGEPIALGGNTGRSTGPHLHLETRYLGIAIDPEQIIDFSTGLPHSDIFAFNKKVHSRNQNYNKNLAAKAATKTASATKSKAKTTKKSKKK